MGSYFFSLKAASEREARERLVSLDVRPGPATCNVRGGRLTDDWTFEGCAVPDGEAFWRRLDPLWGDLVWGTSSPRTEAEGMTDDDLIEELQRRGHWVVATLNTAALAVEYPDLDDAALRDLARRAARAAENSTIFDSLGDIVAVLAPDEEEPEWDARDRELPATNPGDADAHGPHAPRP